MIKDVLKLGACLCLFFTSTPAFAAGLDRVFLTKASTAGGDRADVSNWAAEVERAKADDSRLAAFPITVRTRIEPLRLGPVGFEGASVLADLTAGETPDPCAADAADCALAAWNQRIDALAGRSRHDQLDAVQAMVNALPYHEDQENWGVHDYWATPREMIARGGDCEDFASTKYWALKRLGVPEQDMRIVVVHDDKYDSSHAVLAVQVDGETLVLDNQAREVTLASAEHDYHPYYSVNQNGWWIYRASHAELAQGAATIWPASAGGGRTTITFRATRAPTRWSSARGFSLASW